MGKIKLVHLLDREPWIVDWAVKGFVGVCVIVVLVVVARIALK